MTDDRETLVQCPKCEGVGFLRSETGTLVRAWTCDLCNGDRAVTVTVMRAWKIGQRGIRA
jgi:DnaJ-class molecular chaperone